MSWEYKLNLFTTIVATSLDKIHGFDDNTQAMAKDFYGLLGVNKTADEAELKRAYRKKALEFHPDKNKGNKDAEAKFKEINEAYQTLSDKQKRAYYDQFGTAPTGAAGPGSQSPYGSYGGFGGGPGGFGNGGFEVNFNGGGGGFGDLGDVFESFFGGGGGRGQQRKRSGPYRGNDMETTLKLRFDEAVFGTEKELVISKLERCERCDGAGAEPDSKITTCKTCNGSGEVRGIRQTIFGQVATQRPCDMCEGRGKVPERVCTKCQGTGRHKKTDTTKVKIPAGVDTGSTLKVTGKGEAGPLGGESGDLYVNLTVERSKDYVRDGYDVYTEKEVTVPQAVLGCEIDIKTLYGDIKLKIPAGTPSGKVFRLKEYGIQKLQRSDRGDHMVKVTVVIPTKLSRQEKELYETLRDTQA